MLAALRERVDELEAFGMGGPRMVQAGLRSWKDASEVGIVGIVEVLGHLPRLFRLARELAERAIAERPELAVLIDAPDFHIRVAKRLHAAGVPVVFYVGPSVWAWRPGRAKRYARYIRRLLVLFPFELPIWRAAGVDVVCVGHPLLDEIPEAVPEIEGSRTVALLPGSRPSEIERHLDVLLEAARRLDALADRFVLPVAPGLDARAIARTAAGSPKVAIVTGEAERREAIASAAVAIVASGTATLETALIGRAQVIIYRLAWLTWWIGKLLAKVRFLGLVNLIAGREVAPELLQSRCTAERIAEEASRLLSDERLRRAAVDATKEIRAALGAPGSGARAAEAVLAVARKSATGMLPES